MAFTTSFHCHWRYLTRCYHSLRILRQIVVIIHLMHITPTLFSPTFPLFFSSASALCLFLRHYILFRRKKQSLLVVHIFIQYPHVSGNGGGNTGPLISNHLKPPPRRFFACSLLSSKWFSEQIRNLRRIPSSRASSFSLVLRRIGIYSR